MKREVKVGIADQRNYVFIQDAASSVGAGKTGLVYNTAGLVCYYARPGSAPVAVPLVTQTVTGTHADGGFVELSAANMPGFYRIDLPDACWAAGVPQTVQVMLHGASGMAPVVMEFQLRDTHALTESQEFADALLMRNLAMVESGAVNGALPYRKPIDAFRFLRNKWTNLLGTLTVYKEDDTTSNHTAATSTTAGDPISTVDPA